MLCTLLARWQVTRRGANMRNLRFFIPLQGQKRLNWQCGRELRRGLKKKKVALGQGQGELVLKV